MGKAQSKRSVDITTEVVAEEGTGRVEKIEDVDQLKPPPQVNGDTQQHKDLDQHNKEKNVDNDGAEHEKDLATEKEKPQIDGTTGDLAQEKGDKPDENAGGDPVSKTNQSDELNETTASASTPDSSKKTKKDKLKKKWSFRSISFGKKDKQKPLKKSEEKTEVAKEEPVAATTAVTDTNGECEKVPDENITGDNEPEETLANSVTPTEILDEKKTDDEPVTNGDSKQISRLPEKASIVEEEKTDESETLTGTTQETEKITETILPVDSVIENKDEIKFNGNGIDIESSQIEVKSENDNLTAHSQIPTENSTQSLPPPLPISPQPSQVMVFALNDNNEQQENIENNKSPPIDLNVTPQLQIPSVIETAPTPEIERKEEITPDIVKDIPVTISEEEFIVKEDQAVSVTEQFSEKEVEPEIELSSKIETPEDIEKNSIHENVEVSQPEKEIVEEKELDSENLQQQEKHTVPSLEEKEHIAECLVEEVTQTAVEIVEKQLNNGDGDDDGLPSPHSSDLEVSTAKLNGTNDHEVCTETNNTTTIADEHSTHKENGTEHENETSTTESLNGVIEITKTIEDIKSEPEAIINNTSVEDSPLAVVAAAD